MKHKTCFENLTHCNVTWNFFVWKFKRNLYQSNSHFTSSLSVSVAAAGIQTFHSTRIRSVLVARCCFSQTLFLFAKSQRAIRYEKENNKAALRQTADNLSNSLRYFQYRALSENLKTAIDQVTETYSFKINGAIKMHPWETQIAL